MLLKTADGADQTAVRKEVPKIPGALSSDVLLVVLGVLLVALFSQLPGMLRVRHMSVADVVRKRAQ